ADEHSASRPTVGKLALGRGQESSWSLLTIRFTPFSLILAVKVQDLSLATPLKERRLSGVEADLHV
ncbi:MAG: hypothetical protein AAGA01_08275, partial [Cyanobacteria bacterium P01_E01_bin.43]